MKSKEKKKITIIILIISIIMIIIYYKNTAMKETYAVEEKDTQANAIKISQVPTINIEEIINKNVTGISNKEEIYEKQEELEYITKYRNNNEIYEGTTQVSQEGKNGIQTITMKKSYDEKGNFIKEEQVSCVVTKSSVNKIIDIGTKKYVEPEKPKENTSNEATSTTNGVNTSNTTASTTNGVDTYTVTTKISSSKPEKTTPKKLTFDIKLNEPSGFSLEQFKKALTDSKDVNKIFQNNAQYFYYIEEQYSINGMFIAALGIHESAWGTSKLARNKHNLFGYGAYDSNPYNGAYTFTNYAESIDLLAKVIVKYYINPAGTKIYDGQVASGRYYNGNTISAVNKKYATDKNWANALYKHMQYLYSKLN